MQGRQEEETPDAPTCGKAGDALPPSMDKWTEAVVQFDPGDFSKAAVAARREKADRVAMQLIAQMDINKYEVTDNDVLYLLQ